MPARPVSETYAYLRQIAPAFAQQITAVTAVHNKAKFEHAMSNATATITRELGLE